MNQPVMDIVGLLVFVAAMMFSPDVASIVGPYLVIIIAASIGASFAVARRDKTTRLGAVFFFARVVGLAVLLTAGAAIAVSTYRSDLSPRVVIAPIALMIGFIGDDWASVLSKITSVFYGAIDLFRKGTP